ncbi:hypothetical protein [Bacillus pseudomycoides]|uniref:hypothetical protein n=1 Tax=Bacillus pseudomycoides TaxID=64104 RepID=UPI000503FFCB|nr:hypothetical protein [Bacillus pseudomycoides]KFN12810.1 hypothetical protein DJ94_5009 [Bacillus pseudomycoides]MDR4188083.1 hypothetical protein [Bacillus pseudomycoides]MED0855703.1 hypothetical protein [Bacillus pseudomycoides]
MQGLKYIDWKGWLSLFVLLVFFVFFYIMTNGQKPSDLTEKYTYKNIEIAENLVTSELNSENYADNPNWTQKDLKCLVKTNDGIYRVYFNVEQVPDKEIYTGYMPSIMRVEIYTPKSIKKLVREGK